jgi:hypothetical protein
LYMYIHARYTQTQLTITRVRTDNAHTHTLLHAPTARCPVCLCAFHRRWTPLHAAALNGHADVVAGLLVHGADVNTKGGNGCGNWSPFGQRFEWALTDACRRGCAH